MLSMTPWLVAAVQDTIAGRLRNGLGDAYRAVAHLIDGHETLVLVILAMLVVIYLYLRKA